MKGTSWLLVILAVLAAGALIACGAAEPPTGASSFGPSAGPGVGPSAGPGVGPSSGPGVGPKPGPGVHPSPGGGTGPTPGPTPTPNPSGTPGPTPSPSGSPVPCPALVKIHAVGLPMLLSAALNNDALFPNTPNWEPQCTVKEVKIVTRVTTTTGFVSTPNDFKSPAMAVGVCGGGVGFGGCGQSQTYSFQFNATGNQIGATCGDFVFDTTSTHVFDSTALASPYSGTYQWDAARTGVGDLWRLKSLQYSLINTFNHPPDTVLECAEIDVTTQLVP